MFQIEITEELRNNRVVLGCLKCQVKTERQNSLLGQQIEAFTRIVIQDLTLEQIKELPKIKAARETYKKVGGEPDRYRISSESLLRRIVQGKELYKINNVVDINNYLSLKFLYPVGSYDLRNIKPPIIFRLGQENETYQGLSKSVVKAEGLPVLSDLVGSFGSPISDSARSLISLETSDLMMVIYSFSGKQGLDDALTYAQEALKMYASASDMSSFIFE